MKFLAIMFILKIVYSFGEKKIDQNTLTPIVNTLNQEKEAKDFVNEAKKKLANKNQKNEADELIDKMVMKENNNNDYAKLLDPFGQGSAQGDNNQPLLSNTKGQDNGLNNQPNNSQQPNGQQPNNSQQPNGQQTNDNPNGQSNSQPNQANNQDNNPQNNQANNTPKNNNQNNNPYQKPNNQFNKANDDKKNQIPNPMLKKDDFNDDLLPEDLKKLKKEEEERLRPINIPITNENPNKKKDDKDSQNHWQPA